MSPVRRHLERDLLNIPYCLPLTVWIYRPNSSDLFIAIAGRLSSSSDLPGADRWFKCILGCQHLLALSQNGITIQVYCALIASLLIRLWTGRKPTKRTFEMICLYFQGWASLEELIEHIEGLKSQDQKQQ